MKLQASKTNAPNWRDLTVKSELPAELKSLEVLAKNLAVMDSTAASLCKDNNMPILVFSVDEPMNIYKAVCGENIGTVCG